MKRHTFVALFADHKRKLMQGKGFIKFLLGSLVAVCILQYVYMIPTARVESKAASYAQRLTADIPNEIERKKQERDLVSSYLDSMSSEVIFSIPGLKKFTYDELKQQNLALGLDLKGGQSVVLQVNMKDLVKELSSNGNAQSKDPSLLQALDNAEEALKSSQSDFVTLFAAEYQKIAPDKPLAKIFARNPQLKEKINVQSSNGEVVRELASVAKDVVKLTFNRLKQRIDKLGVTQPNISLDEARDIILVELPGIDNPERARKFLTAGAALEFWDVYRISDPGVANGFALADDFLKAQEDSNIASDSLGNNIQMQGPLLRVLQVNSPGSPLFPLSVMGSANRNQKDIVTAYLDREDVRGFFPAEGKFLWAAKPIKDRATGDVSKDYELYFIKTVAGTDRAPLEGDVVVSASQSPNPQSGEVEVSLRMNSQGAKDWAAITTRAAQDNQRAVAIVLDNEVFSAPSVNTPITGGNSSITGGFSVAEASDLASILEVGKLPAKVEIVQESNVGPSLGAENIRKSLMSFVIGLLAVLAFMIFYYGGAGIVSVLCLIVNMFFIMGALASFGAVLTLPGMAGLLLTIGMAVDANVIIYERVREELRSGKSLLSSIQDGFKNSYSAIIDANVTTIIVAIILAYFGMGPIKGFAVVLIIGVLSSLFTAVLLGKLIIDWWTQTKGRDLTFWTPPSKNAFANLNIDWIGKRKIAYVISGTIITLGIISMVVRGFDLGVDFKGGYSYNVEFAEGLEVDRDQIEDGLTAVFGKIPTVKAVAGSNTYNIVTDYKIDDNGEDAATDVINALHQGISTIQGGSLNLEAFKATDDTGVTHVTAS
ncbi:MAG: SecD/SecF fusion protein, partial [Saprospiraceae bacterium]